MKREILLLIVGLCAGVMGVAAIRMWQQGGARVATVAGTTRAVQGPLDPARLADVYGIHFIAQTVDDGTLPTLPNGQQGVPRDQAIRAAMDAAPAGVDHRAHRLLPNVQVSAQYGLFTDGVSAVLMAVDAPASAVVVAGNDATGGRVDVLDAHTGAIVHAIATHGAVAAGGELVSPSILALDEPAHRAYVTTPGYGTGATSRGLLSVVDTQHGTLVRTVILALPPIALAVDRRAGRVFVVTAANATMSRYHNRGDVTVLDARSGAIVQDVLVNKGAVAVSVDERTGRAFVTVQSTDTNGIPRGPGLVTVLDSTSGRVLRTVAIEQNPYQVVVDERDDHVFALSASSHAPYDGHRTMLDARIGVPLRTARVGPSPTILSTDETPRRLLTMNVGDGAGLGGVSVVDARSGALVRTISLRDTPQAVALNTMMTPSDRQDHLVIAAEDNSNRTCATGPSRVLITDLSRHADVSKGRILRTVAVGKDPRAIAIDERWGRVFVVTAGDADPMRGCIPTEHGAVSVLDARTSRVLRIIPIGVAPTAVAVDERTGRAFVLNTGGAMSIRAAGGWSWLPGWLRRHLPFIPAAPSGVRVQVAPASIMVLDATR
jgi:DNA-binding beta-propeller fold protein YncE